MLYFIVLIIDLTYLRHQHNKEIKWLKDIEKFPKCLDYVFWFLSNFAFTSIKFWCFGFYLFVKDKQACIILFIVLGMESIMKRLLAVIFIDPRPFMVDQYIANKICFCAFGNPSGHTSLTFSFYFIFLYYFLLRKQNIKQIWKYICLFFYLIITILLCLSRMYEGSHFTNQILQGLTIGYVYTSLFMYLCNTEIMSYMFNEKTIQFNVKDQYDEIQLYKQEQRDALSVFGKGYDEDYNTKIRKIQISTKENQKQKGKILIFFLLYYFLILITGMTISYYRVENFEKKDSNFFQLTTCGRRCQQKAQKEGGFLSYHPWVTSNPYQFYLVILVYLYFNKKVVRVQNKNYFSQSFYPIDRFVKRLLCLGLILLPTASIYRLTEFYSEDLMLFIATIPVFIVQGLILIYIHIWLMKIAKCQIPGDLFYVPQDKFIEHGDKTYNLQNQELDQEEEKFKMNKQDNNNSGFDESQYDTEQNEIVNNLEKVYVDDIQSQKDQEYQMNIEPMSSVRIQHVNNNWEPYFNAKQNSSKLVKILYGWHKFRDSITRPFTRKVPYFRKSIGQFTIYVLVVASILPIVYYPLFSKEAEKFSEGLVEGKVAKWPATLFLTLTFAFATRNSLIGFLTGISYDDQIKMHKFFSYVAIVTGWLHGLDEIIDSNIPFNASNMWSGFTLGAVMAALVLEGIIFKWFQKQFELFLFLHWIMLITVLVFSVLHYAAIATYVGGGLLAVDLLIRLFMSLKFRKRTKNCHIRKVCQTTAEIYFFNNEKDFVFDAGQYLFINIPQISQFEWHPYTMQTCPYEHKVSLYIRNIGSFSEKLVQLSETQKEIKVRINGPYGQPQLDIQSSRYEYFIFFAGGIGITPMQSMAKSLLYEFRAGRPLKKIIFCWTGRDLDFFDKVMNVQHFCDQLYRFCENEQDKSVLKMILHVTSSQLDKSQINVYEQHIQHKLKFGRLPLDQIVKEAQIEAHGMGLKKIAVLTCGPHSMMQSVTKIAEKRNRKFKKVRVDYHRETFSFLTELL